MELDLYSECAFERVFCHAVLYIMLNNAFIAFGDIVFSRALCKVGTAPLQTTNKEVEAHGWCKHKLMLIYEGICHFRRNG